MDFKEVQEKIQNRLTAKSEEDLIKEEEDILMANYLSEIERIQRKDGINRKELAKNIKTSPSYLTQVFRGDKPLNFYTIAKIQRALNIRFQVNSLPAGYKLPGIIPTDVIFSENLTKKREVPILNNYTNDLYPIMGGALTHPSLNQIFA